MQLFDISMEISEDIPVYNNQAEGKPKITVIRDFASGNAFESHIAMGLHTGTHIDAPLHMLPFGHNMKQYELSNFITECIVLDLKDASEKITDEDLRGKNIEPGSFVLLKTKNSYVEGFDPEFVYLSVSGAEYLKELKVSGVGIDSLGIERSQPGHETHKVLLGSGIVILEGLRLSAVEEGVYQLIALPIKLQNTEAAPARAVLVKP